MNYKGTFKEHNGEIYTRSFKVFKRRKKEFNKRYYEKTGRRFKDDFPNSTERESLYKHFFQMDSIDVFKTGNISQISNIDKEKLRVCEELAKTFSNSDI